jgi:hypothetical protein
MRSMSAFTRGAKWRYSWTKAARSRLRATLSIRAAKLPMAAPGSSLSLSIAGRGILSALAAGH